MTKTTITNLLLTALTVTVFGVVFKVLWDVLRAQ
jgi:hypothetical protein